MAYVTPRLQSIVFTGSNNAAVEAVITDPQYSVVQSDGVRVRWQASGEESLYVAVNTDEWLLYQDCGTGGTIPVRSINDADYQAQYLEIS